MPHTPRSRTPRTTCLRPTYIPTGTSFHPSGTSPEEPRIPSPLTYSELGGIREQITDQDYHNLVAEGIFQNLVEVQPTPPSTLATAPAKHLDELIGEAKYKERLAHKEVMIDIETRQALSDSRDRLDGKEEYVPLLAVLPNIEEQSISAEEEHVPSPPPTGLEKFKNWWRGIFRIQ